MAAVRHCRTPLVVGIDPRPDLLPAALAADAASAEPRTTARAIGRFSREVIDVVGGSVPAVKPQVAWFERAGPAGMEELARVIEHAQSAGLLVILDGKRNDIGITAEAYAQAWMGRAPASAWGCDALTVNPYPGDDGLLPFVEQGIATGSGTFVLVRTSNPGSHLFQEAAGSADGERLYHRVAEWVQNQARRTAGSTGYGVVGAVIGATHPAHLSELRGMMPNTIFLIPGYGAQGGRAEDLAPAFDSGGLGAIVNSSRAIIFAEKSERYRGAGSWQAAAEQAMRDAIAEMPRIAEGH